MKANWHPGEELPTVPQERPYDPFTDPTYRPPLPPIDVSTSKPELSRHILDLHNQEKQLFEEGIECPIKGRGETTCLACPVSAANDPTDPKGRLCRVGQEQERVSTTMIVKQNVLMN